MSRTDRAIVAIASFVFVGVMVTTFTYNLPKWCKNPEGRGNWMVMPLCPKA